MNKFRGAHFLLRLALLFGVFSGLFGGQVALAAQENSNDSLSPPPSQEEPPAEEPNEESVMLYCQYPILQNTLGSSFEFKVTIDFWINERRPFELNLILSPGWTGVTKAGYPEKAIAAYEPEPRTRMEDFTIEIKPVSGNVPEPGEYVFTFEATSGELYDSVELTAVVVSPAPWYSLDIFTSTGQDEVQVKAGEDNHISIIILNLASGDLEDITLSSVTPEDWNIVFTPSDVASLESGLSQEIDVVINPPSNTEAGDYPIILEATSEKADSNLELRVAVITTTAWGGIGIGIAAGIIAGLIVWIRRLGKR